MYFIDNLLIKYYTYVKFYGFSHNVRVCPYGLTEKIFLMRSVMSKVKLAVIADIHHYSSKLGDTGRAYELRSGSDQKCLAESGAVVDSAFEMLAESDVDAVLIAGDITNDGERVSHEEILAKMQKLNEKKSVYLITSTHDWCSDNHARRFSGEEVFTDVETLSREEVRNWYASFGEKTLLSSFDTAQGFTSRSFLLGNSVRLLAINDDCNGEGGKSGYDEDHLNWVFSQLQEAKEKGEYVIATEHHLLLHNVGSLINKGQSIADNFGMASRLADAGLRLMFVGHSHMQRTTEFVSENGNKITQVNVGSLCGYPAPVNYVTIENGEAKIEVDYLDKFTYKGKEYGASFFEKHTSDVMYNLLNSAVSDKKDFNDRLLAQGIRIKNYDKLYPVIKKGANILLNMKVGTAGRLINFLTFGKGVDRKSLKAIKNELLLPLVIKVFLCVFDGSKTAKGFNEETKKVVFDAGTLFERTVKKLPLKENKKSGLLKTAKQISDIAGELVYPAEPDNENCVISL